MYSHYEQRQGRSLRNYERNEDNYETMSSTTYRSSMTPRITNVQRSRPTGLSAPGVSTRIYQSYLSTGHDGSFGPGLASLVHFPGVPLRGGSTGVNTAVVSINTARQRDKRDLEHLNDKFAQYVEKVRFLEAHNRKLVLEIDGLRNRAGQGSSRIKEMYDIEIIEANKLIDESKRDATATNIRKQQAEQELNHQKAQYNHISGLRETDRREIDALHLQIAENEAQIALFRRRMNDLEEETRRYKKETQRLSSEIVRLQNEIQNELFLKSSCEVEKLSVEDDLTTLKHSHEVDLAELRSNSVSNDLDPSKFFRNELSEAIREIRNDYETTIDNQRNTLQNRYSLFVNETTIHTQQRDANPLFSEQQRRQVDRIRNELVQALDQNSYLRNKNRDMENSIVNLRQKIKDLNDAEIFAKNKAERDINEARRQLERIDHTFTDVTAFKTTLEKEIATYRELLESPEGLRGCADRIVQNAEQKTLDRSSSKSYRFDNNKRTDSTTSTTISRTYMNTVGTNYGYEDSNTATSVKIPVNQPSSSSNYYHTLSSTYRNVPVHEETVRHSSLWDRTARDYNLRDSPIRDNSSRNSQIRDNSSRNSPIRDNSSRNSPIRDYSSRNSPVRDYSSRNNTNRNSSIHDSRSSSRESESSVRENAGSEYRQSPEYETV